MENSFNVQDAIDFINADTLGTWVMAHEQNKEYQKQGRTFDLADENELNDILELLNNESYKEAFTLYLDRLDKGTIMDSENIKLLKKYAKYLSLDAPQLDLVLSIEEAEKKGLVTWNMTTVIDDGE